MSSQFGDDYDEEMADEHVFGDDDDEGIDYEDDPEINEIVAQYIDTQRNNTYCKLQINNIIEVLNDIENVDWDAHPSPIVDWNELVKEMLTCNTAWEVKLTDMYVRVMRQRFVQHPQGDDAFAVLLQGEDDVLTAYEQEALAMFDAQPWTAQFNIYKQNFFESVRDSNTEVQDKILKGSANIRLPFTTMRFAYIQLMQHVFDVPTIDDFGNMQYQKFQDPSGVQILLQQDLDWIDLLNHAGECVLYEVDDVLHPEHHELPHLFHDMTRFYGYIHNKLQAGDRAVTPETQPMVVETDEPFQSQHLRINYLLRQLKQMCHLE